jgi:hypothetical protein
MRFAIMMAMLAAPAAATEVVRLSDAQRDAVIAAAASGPEKTPVLTPEAQRRPSVLDRSLYPEFFADGGSALGDRKVHGEVSIFAGSGGTFGMSGTAILPVGQTGTAAISVMQGTGRFGGLSGFSLGYASGDAQNSLMIGNSFGGFGGWGGGWNGGRMLPYGQPRRRR